MGQRGPAPKPGSRSQRRNEERGADLVLAEGPWLEPPPADEGWLEQTREDWDTYWQTDLAKIVAETDLPALKRLFTLRDQIALLEIDFTSNPTTHGSRDQVILNPLGRHLQSMYAELRQIEDRFGLTPMSRLRLGITVGESQKSLDELNRRIAKERRGPKDDDDPRLP